MILIYYLFLFFFVYFKYNVNKTIIKYEPNRIISLKKKYRILFENNTNNEKKDVELNIPLEPLFNVYNISESFESTYLEEKKKKKNYKIINKKKTESFLETKNDNGNNDNINTDPTSNKKDKVIERVFDHYIFRSTSEKMIEDISVDAKTLSKHIVGMLGFEYNKNNSTQFNYSRFLVINNNGNERYKIALITKYPLFNKVQSNKERNTNFMELKNDNSYENLIIEKKKLYEGEGTLKISNNVNDNEKNINKNIKKEKTSYITKFINFLYMKNNDNINNSLEILNINNFRNKKKNYNNNNTNDDLNNKNNNNLNNKNNDLNNKNNDLHSIDKLLEQYIRNLKNKDKEIQELIVITKLEINLTSEYFLKIIDNTISKIEEIIKKNFISTDTIKFDLTYPLNVLCFFIPRIFNLYNINILQQVLIIIKTELNEYIESWSFSNPIYLDNIYENDELSEQKFKNLKRYQKYKKKKKYIYKSPSFLFNKMDATLLLKDEKKKEFNDKKLRDKVMKLLPKEFQNFPFWNLSITRVPNAWFLIGYGDPDIKVCIIDSGADIHHIDLKDNVYIPKYRTTYYMTHDFYDFMVRTPEDNTGHGSHVAGIIGGNINGVGIVGISQGSKLIHLRFMNQKENGATFNAIKALNICVINKAPIINASWCSNLYDEALFTALSKLKYTFDGKGTLFITAAGNQSLDNDTLPLYPGNFKLNNIISIASISSDLNISPFSNYGRNNVHFYAPGHHIYSSIPGNKYKYNSGTSMAAPHVSGISALIYSICKLQGFVPEAEEVKDILIRTGIDVKTDTKKTIHETLVNAEGAVLMTLLGGLWMQIDCAFSQFVLNPGKKKHIPIFFSAYKKGLYKLQLIITISTIDKDIVEYGEIEIPIAILTDSDFAGFKKSPNNLNIYKIDKNEEDNDELLSYICDNAIYTLESYNLTLKLGAILLGILIGIIIIIIFCILKSKKYKEYRESIQYNNRRHKSSIFQYFGLKTAKSTKNKLEDGYENLIHTEENEHLINDKTNENSTDINKEKLFEKVNFNDDIQYNKELSFNTKLNLLNKEMSFNSKISLLNKEMNSNEDINLNKEKDLNLNNETNLNKEKNLKK